jgi:hypothetical protein
MRRAVFRRPTLYPIELKVLLFREFGIIHHPQPPVKTAFAKHASRDNKNAGPRPETQAGGLDAPDLDPFAAGC